MADAKAPDGLSGKVLLALLAAIFMAVSASYVAQGSKMDRIAADVGEAKGLAGQALRATVQIETRLATMDDADTAAAAAEIERLRAEVLDLQQRQRAAGR
jgi:hypothetical protein